MPTYLSSARLQQAIERLSNSAARPRLAEYLILKRSMKLSQSEEVALSQRNDHFVQAMKEMASCAPPDAEDSWLRQPFFIVFGTAREKEKGYRSHKYISNGTADTVGGWIATGGGIVELLGTRPRVVKFGNGYSPEKLTDFFLTSGPRPRLDDTACWWYRFADLADRLTEAPSLDELERGFVEDLGLEDSEIDALFTTSPSGDEE